MAFYQVAASALLLLLPDCGVSAHGYLKSPRARNYVAHEDGSYWPILASNPLPEAEPQSANIGGTEAQCGIIQGQRNYDLPMNHVGGLMHPNQQACYRPGQVIDVEVVLTAHHMGHYEFHACPIAHGEVPNQACFDANPMEYVSENALPKRSTSALAPPDPNYPTRAYIPPQDYHTSYKYRLPADLAGDLVLIQWYYITANSCSDIGYDQYDFPTGWDGYAAPCQTEIPPDGRGVPEQFWNCAEVRISEDCDGTTAAPVAAPPAPPPTTAATGAPVTTDPAGPTEPTDPAGPVDPHPSCAAMTGACGPSVTCDSIGFPGFCCSEFGYCGQSSSYCGKCCQSGPCDNEPEPPVTPTTPTPVPPTPPTPTTPVPPTPPIPSDGGYTADHGEDSRLIAYVGNWQACPTAEQVDAYSHIVVAFSVSYAWAAGGNNCDAECNIAGDVPLCENTPRPDLIDEWRAKGKKVILSFGGAGMGGSWKGDYNNCWDYCFGREDAAADQLVNIVDDQNFDGIDIDYEYCYDIGNKQAGKCEQRTALYSDIKAQEFLDEITHKLRLKLDALQGRNGYDRGRYEITHAPMDTDLLPSTEYFRILRDRRADLDFLMPQFYNGVTRPAYGVETSWDGQTSGAEMFRSLSNDMFNGEPTKVVFGHCIYDCQGTGSNISAEQAVQVTADLKTVYDGEFACNGGAFFWVAAHDIIMGGTWSNPVLAEVRKTAGCSHGDNGPVPSPPTPPTPPTPTPPPTPSPVNSSPNGGGGSSGGCVAVPQDQLPEGSWETNDEQCSICADGTIVHWPCDSNLCECSNAVVMAVQTARVS